MTAKVLADLVCPALGACVVLAPLSRRPRRTPWPDWAAAGLAVGWVYLARLAVGHVGAWRTTGLDFSTHTGVALALAIALGRHARKRWWLLGVLLVAYAGLMVALAYHTVPEIVVSAAITAPGALAAPLLVARTRIARIGA